MSNPIQVQVKFDGTNEVLKGLYNTHWRRPNPLGFLTFGLALGEIWVYDFPTPSNVWTDLYVTPTTTWSDQYSTPTTVWTDCYFPYG